MTTYTQEQITTLRASIAVAITELFNYHKDDTQKEFSLPELEDVCNVTEPLMKAKLQIEHIYRAAWDVLAAPSTSHAEPLSETKSIVSALKWAGSLIRKEYEHGHNGADSWLMNYSALGEDIRNRDHRKWVKSDWRWVPVDVQAAPSTSEEISRLKDLLSEVSANFSRDDDLPNDLLPRIDAAIKEGTQ